MKVAFFDRDGTIAEDYPDDKWAYINKPVFMPYAPQTLKYINDLGYHIIIVTNQYLIGEGFITQAQYEEYNNQMLKNLKSRGINVFDVFYCPHARKDNCECIKPNTGMIMQALKKHPEIDLSESFMVGDSICDVQLAEKLNIPVYGINIDYKYEKFTQIKSLKELIYLLRI